MKQDTNIILIIRSDNDDDEQGLKEHLLPTSSKPKMATTPSKQPPPSMVRIARALVVTGTLLLLASVVAPTLLTAWHSRRHAAQRRNVMRADYSNVEHNHDEEYFKLSHAQRKDFHWCLFGDDSACTCPGFARGTGPEWTKAHKGNEERLVLDEFYEIVFYGDGLVQGLNDGVVPMTPINKATYYQYQNNFAEDNHKDGFTYSAALGIAGDSTANLLYRLKNGEMPPLLYVNVFWLMIGANDLRQGNGCSEQATVLGILKSALMLHDQFPQSILVIQGILPQGYDEKDECSLEEPKHSFLGGRDDEAVEKVESPFLWSSIQRINAQLQEFCAQHERFVFFDASDLFIEKSQQHSHSRIDRRLMPDCQHLSPLGYQVLASAISEEYKYIVLDEDTENRIAARPGWLDSKLENE